MAAKARIEYVCSECGHTSTKWLGNCPSCGQWHTFQEFKVESKAKSTRHKAKVEGVQTGMPAQKLSEIDYEDADRFPSNITELDRVLGGGFMPGSFLLIGGDPGIGKSTLALQVARSNPELSILYCTGEESAGQVKQRSVRLGVDSSRMLVYTETDISHILSEAQEQDPDLLIIDSIQTVYRTELQSMPGSVQQIKECAALLQQLAKRQNITTLVIGHVTKEGDLAGPRVLEHMVDTVLQFEGDGNHTYRILRSLKNRFGPAQEIGVFDMGETGLVDITNPSRLFLSENQTGVSGNAVVCTIEGSRPLLVEVQALVTPSNYGTPQRTVNGFDHRRLSLLLAVLEKRRGFQFSGQDVYLNVAGGLRLSDTAGDLGVVCALVSSLLDKPLSAEMALLGEVGLGAEVRSVSRLDQRLSEVEKMGFSEVVIPAAQKQVKTNGLKLLKVKTLEDAIKIAI
ncbi:MAG: DNA repair protein RadA [Balneolaceae bacterium]